MAVNLGNVVVFYHAQGTENDSSGILVVNITPEWLGWA